MTESSVTSSGPVTTPGQQLSVDLFALPGEDLARAAGVEHLPTGSPYVGTHHLEGARSAFKCAQEATRPGDIEGYLARAQEHMLYAERNMHSAMGQWAEYNRRLDRVIAFLNEHEVGHVKPRDLRAEHDALMASDPGILRREQMMSAGFGYEDLEEAS